jgi:hypothetical protein
VAADSVRGVRRAAAVRAQQELRAAPTFLTPLVVILVDLLNPSGWRLASDRLVDTLIGCAIVLFVGFAPWWTSWYAHLPAQFAVTAGKVADYMEAALCPAEVPGSLGSSGSAGSSGGGVPSRSRLRRRTYRALADLRAEFQRTMSEPPAISRRASAWWPALVALEEVMDAVTALALAVDRGAPAPSPDGVRAVSSVMRGACTAAATGAPVPGVDSLPSSASSAFSASSAAGDESLGAVIEAVKALLGVLRSGEDRLTAAELGVYDQSDHSALQRRDVGRLTLRGISVLILVTGSKSARGLGQLRGVHT